MPVHRTTPALLGLALLAGCASARPPRPVSGPTELAFEPQLVVVGPADLELAGKNDEELFAIGQAAFAARDFARAAAAFDRLVDLHPGSSHLAAALARGGVAHQRLEAWGLALERFRALERRDAGPGGLEASFKVAECLYHLDDLAAAAEALARLAARTDLTVDQQVRALTQLGVVEFETGAQQDSERHLGLAVSTWRAGSERERLDASPPAQALYHLGEIHRSRFLAVDFDPSRDDARQLAQALEAKATLLLSAQDHYLGAIRAGRGAWAVASGYRIGELYDALHAALVEAPPPPGLDAPQAEAYRSELRRLVRVLVVTAVGVYEQTLAVAGRSRADPDPFVAETQEALERMKRALDDVPPEE